MKRNSLAEWALTFLLLAYSTTFIAQANVIPTSSMHNTVLTGDHLIVDKLAYSPGDAFSRHLLPYREPKRGDIIVFRHPVHLQENLVKRVIGVPGDHIRMVQKQVWLNGHVVSEPYVVHISTDYFALRDDFPPTEAISYPPDPDVAVRGNEMLRSNVVGGELVVPAASYFAMGDNRDNSLDSRFWGLVPRENIVGKPVVIFWSYDAPTEDLQEYSVKHFTDLAAHFFTKTRWDRTLKLVRAYPLE